MDKNSGNVQGLSFRPLLQQVVMLHFWSSQTAWNLVLFGTSYCTKHLLPEGIGNKTLKIIKHLSSTILKCIYHSEAKYQNVNFFSNLQHTSGTSGRVLQVSLPGQPASTRVERKADTLAEASRAVALEQTTFSQWPNWTGFCWVSKKSCWYLLQGGNTLEE